MKKLFLLTLSFLIGAGIIIFFVNLTFQNGLTPYPFQKVKGFPTMPISDSNYVTKEGVELGRYLFYDPILSNDSTVSCASCHKQEFAFGDTARFSIGVNGKINTRNTPPLFNLAWYPRLFWDGKANSIEEQVFFPVRSHSEMNLDWKEAEKRVNRSAFYKPLFANVFGKPEVDSLSIAYAIAQFERTLISSNSKLDQVLRKETKLTYLEYRGLEIVTDLSMGNCIQCHPMDGYLTGTTFQFSNNGLEDFNSIEQYTDKGLGGINGNQADIGKFKIPSLRNVAVTGPYMHDGRFNSLDEVVAFYSDRVHPSPNIDSKMVSVENGGVNLTQEEKTAVIAFLNCLTDTNFITNPEFSNPFE